MSGSLQQQLHALRTTVTTSLELFSVRLQMAKLDFLQIKAGLKRMVIFAAATLVLSLLAFIALMFGLNAVLAPETKVWVFFGMAAVFTLAIIILGIWAFAALNAPKKAFEDTFAALQNDLAILRGESPTLASLDEIKQRIHS